MQPGFEEARVPRHVAARAVDRRTARFDPPCGVAVEEAMVDDHAARGAGRVRFHPPVSVGGENVVADDDVAHPAVTADHDPAVAVCDDRVVDDHGVVVLGIDLDPEAFGVVVDHVVRDQIVGAFDVHAMALVLPGEVVPAVVVDPVAEDLDRACTRVGEDALVLPVVLRLRLTERVDALVVGT